MAKPTRYTKALYEEYTRRGYWTDKIIADYWAGNAERYPHREAIVDSRLRLTWSEAGIWIDRLALGFLDLGLKKDDMVVVQLPNSVELTLLRVACEKAGLLCLPVLRTFRHAEMEYLLKFAEPAAIVILKEFRGFNYRDMIKEIRPRLPSLKHVVFAGEDVPQGELSIDKMAATPIEKKYPAGYLASKKTPWNEYSLVLHTSGTTGLPRLAEFPVCSNVYVGHVGANILGLGPDDIVFTLSPAGLGPSMVAHLVAPICASKIVMEEHFAAEEALQIIEREKVTCIGAVPTQLSMLAAVLATKKYDTSTLKYMRVTGSPLSFQTGKDAEEKLGGKLIQAYGSVDFSTICCNLRDDPQVTRLTTVGPPPPGNEIKLVDDSGHETPKGEIGEIWGRGPTSISGYYRDPAGTHAAWKDGWCHTGDLGKWDPEGRLMVVGRKKEMIIRGGQNIYPAEIEALLATHPGISASAVVAMPDPVMGEKACAYIVPKAGRQVTFAEMVGFLKDRGIAPFKLPERMELVDQLPMVADGQKVDKKLLARQIAEKLKIESGLP